MKKNGTIRESGKRSRLEEQFSALLGDLGVPEQYETLRVNYTIPASKHTYIIDFSLPNGVQCELKGYLRDIDERRKYELIKEQHPQLDLRFVFAEPNKRITRTKMTHGSWADKVGFKWCGIRDVDVIKQWSGENNNNESN